MDSHTTHQSYCEHDADLLGLVGDIYQAGLEPERWPEVLRQICAAFDADLACIYTPTVPRPDQLIYLTHNLSESTQDEYSAYYNQLDAWTISALRQNLYHEGLLSFGEQLVPQQELHRTEFYNDFLKPNGMEWMITTALLDGQMVPQMPSAHMTFMRHPDHASFEPDKIQLIAMLAPHVRRALLTHWRLSEASLGQAAHQFALDSLGNGVILLGENGAVVYLNAFAERLLLAADGFRIQTGQLLAHHAQEQARLSQLLRQAAIGQGGGMTLRRASGKRTLGLTALPLGEQPRFRALGEARVMLLIHDPGATPALNGLKAFAARHHLTPAEQRVFTLLLNDLAPKQIADQLGVGIRTVRAQLSSLYAKTDTRNQRDLILLAVGRGPWAVD